MKYSKLLSFLLLASSLQAIDYNILMEERVNSERKSQTLLKFQLGHAITDDLYFFSALWLRDQLPILYEHNGGGLYAPANSEYINFIDLYGGLSYSLASWFSPYFFYEQYYDNSAHETDFFVAIGFSGTVFDSGNHNVGYFSELYGARNSNNSLDGFGIFGSETAAKYKYAIYDKQAALYIQAVWNTDAAYTDTYKLVDGYYSTRFGIQLNF